MNELPGLPGPKGDKGDPGENGATGPRGERGAKGERYIAYRTRGRFLLWQTVLCFFIFAAMALGAKALIDQGDQNNKTEKLAKANTVLIARLNRLVREADQRDAETRATAAKACKSSRTFGPDFIRFLESFKGTEHALGDKTLTFFRNSRPKTCPGDKKDEEGG